MDIAVYICICLHVYTPCELDPRPSTMRRRPPRRGPLDVFPAAVGRLDLVATFAGEAAPHGSVHRQVLEELLHILAIGLHEPWSTPLSEGINIEVI